MTIEELLNRQRPRREVQGIAAALLPYEADGRIAVDAFSQLLISTRQAGLTNAVNMDTGYVNYLTDEEKLNVLEWTSQALGSGVPFVAGAYIENKPGDNIVELYRNQIDTIVRFDAIPILFQTSRLHGAPPEKVAQVYRDAARGYPRVLAFELGSMFAPNGKIYEEETVRRLMDIPEIKGMKHSSLNRLLELERLVLRDKHRPDFRIYTGNDLGINMIEYGSDYLLGLAAFAPEKFAERDQLWRAGDPEYYALSDALQHLGNIAFREPVPAYKNSAAAFLHAIGRIPTDQTHPLNPRRPAWESEVMMDCARRLSLIAGTEINHRRVSIEDKIPR
jgi:dihydrodipicolinate synthase/N-acetylneuraminate lyase